MNFLSALLAGSALAVLCGTAVSAPAGGHSSPTPSFTDTLPSHVNNAESMYFPAVFNQDGGSCGSASRIGYMFTHEINAFRGADASLPENVYPTHFTWLLTNSNSGKEGMAMANGVPNSVVYGGATYSRLFGNQDCANPDFGWMQGYDKWYSAMFNRISHNSFAEKGVDTQEGREFVKRWLWNHNGDKDFKVGGIAGIGVASACKQGTIANDPEGHNAAAGVVGMKYVTRWGDGVDHALTIVGYDDRIAFDLDSNNVYGEWDKDERGAWIIVNSWGAGWANKGFIYCPYKYGFPVRRNEGGAWKPEFYHVRKNYRPLRTLKVLMEYSRRSELRLSIGASSDPNATEPDITFEMEHFKFAGDGTDRKANNGKEAPTPMLGKWADGAMHGEPMEFGYDLTDLSLGFDTRRPVKYFFIIESRPEAIGTGRVHTCSVIDYEFDRQGIEIPMNPRNGTTIENKGGKTILTTVVGGEPFFAPANLHLTASGTLAWNAPQRSWHQLKGYVVYCNGAACDTLSPNVLQYAPPQQQATYSVAAAYLHADSLLASARTAGVTPGKSTENKWPSALNLRHSGLIIPDVFRNHCEEATIEYWLRPRSWRSWNQSVGPGWGRFLIHANDDGSVTAGWDTDNRIDTRPGIIKTDVWTHFAITVAKDTLRLYVNGQQVDTLISKGRKGIGGFGNLPFGNSHQGALDGDLAEIRIWKKARTAKELQEMMHHRFEAAGIPESMLAYFKGHLEKSEGKEKWADATGAHHARFASFGRRTETFEPPVFSPLKAASVRIEAPAAALHAGQSFRLKAHASPSIASLRWDAPEAGIQGLALQSPELIYEKEGDYQVRLTGTTLYGEEVIMETTVHVLPAVFTADFQTSKTDIPAGERISFQPYESMPGARYEWRMPGADIEKAFTSIAAATYEKAGNYRVKLRLTDPLSGKTKRSSLRLNVHAVAPQAAFDLSPRIVLRGQEVTLNDRSRFAPVSWQWLTESRLTVHRAEGRHATLKIDEPGVYDITLTATNKVGSNSQTQKQALIVCNADSKNGLNFSRPEAALTTSGKLYTDSAECLTVDWWMNAGRQSATTGIGHSAGTWQLRGDANGRLILQADSLTAQTAGGFIVSDSWHHYAVAFDRGEVSFFRDGEKITTSRLAGKKRQVRRLPAIPALRLGGEATPMNGVIDEVRVWQKALNEKEIQAYANAPINDVAEAESKDHLLLYYNFNQNGGDVMDATSHQLHGRRTNFGPGGDAWGLSAGVFCLNFDTPLEDVTARHLPASQRPFATTGRTVNKGNAQRFLEFDAKGWTIENATGSDTLRTGLHVDRNKGEALTVCTGWDGFANELRNHKIYCTTTLPAGKYELEVIPYGGEMAASGSMIAVVAGKGLPDRAGMSDALAAGSLSDRRLPFLIEKETEVSLGLVFMLKGQTCIPIERIVLRRVATENKE